MRIPNVDRQLMLERHLVPEGKGSATLVHVDNERLACAPLQLELEGLAMLSSRAAQLFAGDVRRAMEAGVPLVLAHEAPGAVGVEAARHSVEFEQPVQYRVPCARRRGALGL